MLKKLHVVCRKSYCISCKLPTFAAFMKECVQPYYLQDGEVRTCDSFDIRLINEGISVYEVVRLMDTKLLFLEDHLDRLHKSLLLAGLDPLKEKDIWTDLQLLLAINDVREGNVKIVLNEKSDGTRHFLIYFVGHRYPSESDFRNGVKVITYPFERKDPNKKIWRPGFRMQVAESLEKAAAFEALLTDSDGFIREASKANVFAVSRGTILTPPDNMILPGITRSRVLKICKKLGMPVVYNKLDLKDIGVFDAMFLSGTSTKVLPISQIDGFPVVSDNPILKQISEQYDLTIQEYLNLVNHS